MDTDKQQRRRFMQIGNSIFTFYTIPNFQLGNFYPISAGDLTRELNEQGITTIIITDDYKNVYPIGVYEQFAKIELIDTHPYIPTTFDCDKFSIVATADINCMINAACFGMIHVNLPNNAGKHALCFFRNTDGTYWYFEPQTNEMFPFSSTAYKPYFAYC